MADELTPGTLQGNPAETVTPQPAPEPQGQPTQVATAEKPNFYTPEEIESLLTQDSEVDTTRLSPEGRLLMKSFQRGLGPKLMERSTLKSELESLRKEIASSKQPATLEEFYDKDPVGTFKYIDQEIGKLRTKLNTAEAFEALDKIEELRSSKDALLLRGIQKQQDDNRLNAISTTAQSEVMKEIPDFNKKEPSLTEFAIKQLGYSLEDVRFLSDPVNTGPYSAKFIIQVNKMYDMMKAKQTAETKQVKTPLRQEGAGTGGEQATDKTAYNQALKNAQKTGDWTEVLRLKGTLDRLRPGG